MNLSFHIGKTYQETEFYELLLFEIEDNFNFFYCKNIHFHFERTADVKIKITDVVYFNSCSEMNRFARSVIEKKEWVEISENVNHIDLVLVRFDRTGTLSVIYPNKTHTEDWCTGWADEGPSRGPLTEEELRAGFRELCGFFEGQIEQQNLKSKKAV
jgi:hypothetical protein